MIHTATKKINRTRHFVPRLLRQPFISSREKEVLKLIAYEFTSKEIATALYLSEHTIDTHKKNLKTKMDVKNTAGMIRRGFELGLLSL